MCFGNFPTFFFLQLDTCGVSEIEWLGILQVVHKDFRKRGVWNRMVGHSPSVHKDFRKTESVSDKSVGDCLQLWLPAGLCTLVWSLIFLLFSRQNHIFAGGKWDICFFLESLKLSLWKSSLHFEQTQRWERTVTLHTAAMRYTRKETKSFWARKPQDGWSLRFQILTLRSSQIYSFVCS